MRETAPADSRAAALDAGTSAAVAPDQGRANLAALWGVRRAVPRLSEFYGIVIAMYYSDHEPPHVHAISGEHRAAVAFGPVGVTAGALPQRVQSMVFEWTALHQAELLENWERARVHAALHQIAPLE